MKKQSKSMSQSFAQGTVTIMIAMAAVKILGAVFKIPLLNILGGEGYGYFNSAYNLYNPIYALSTVGLPLAVSKMVSEKMTERKFKDIEAIRKASASIFIFMGIAGTLLMFLCAYPFARLTHSPNVIYSIFLLAPTIFFACLISIYKGYYQGIRNMVPTAVSEVVESAGKVVFGLAFSYFAMAHARNEFSSEGTVFGIFCETSEKAYGLIAALGAAGAILGITVASVFGFAYIFWKHIKLKNKVSTRQEFEESPEPESKKILLKKLIKLAIPIGLGAIIMNLSGTIDSVVIQNRLNYIMGCSPQILLNSFAGAIPQSNIDAGTVHVFLWGCFGTMTTITMLIPTFLQAISINALPMVTETIARKDEAKMKKDINSVLKLTTLIAMPCGMGLSAVSYPICNLLYGATGESYIASCVMVLAGIGIIFVSISAPLCSILQAAGRADIPLKLLSAGLFIKIVLNYVLVGIPEINIQGANISTLVCYLFICIGLTYYIKSVTSVMPNLISTIVKPALCAVGCAVSAAISYGLLEKIINGKLATIGAIAVAGAVYLALLLLTKTIDESDIEMFPFADKILKHCLKAKKQ